MREAQKMFVKKNYICKYICIIETIKKSAYINWVKNVVVTINIEELFMEKYNGFCKSIHETSEQMLMI